MKTFVALMRGINVGGHHKLPMAELKALCGGIGLDNPQTYIQSGNLLVDAQGGADDVREALEQAIAGRFGFSAHVIVRTADAWDAYVRVNPFAGEPEVSPKALHLCLTRAPLKAGAAKALEERAQQGERLREAGGALWIDFGEGLRDSKLSAALIDKACGSTATARNWNTVLKIAEMIAAR